MGTSVGLHISKRLQTKNLVPSELRVDKVFADSYTEAYVHLFFLQTSEIKKREKFIEKMRIAPVRAVTELYL